VPWNNPHSLISFQTERLIGRIKAVVLLPMLYIIGLAGNILNAMVFARQGLRERINMCLFTLAVTDLACTSIVMAYHAENIYTQLATNDNMSPVFEYLVNHNGLGVWGLSYGSSLLIAVISTERCICVLFPFQAKKCVSTSVLAPILVILILLLTGVYFLIAEQYIVLCFYDEASGRVKMIGVKKYLAVLQDLNGILYGFCLCLACPVVVFITTLITSVKLYQTIKWRKSSSSYSRHSTFSGNTPSFSTAMSTKELSVTKMLIGVSIEYLIFSIPGIIILISPVFEPQLNPGGIEANVLSVLNSLAETGSFAVGSVNFFVYYFAGSRYRDTLKSLVCKNKQQQKGKTVANVTRQGNRN
jgi:hypothetical protein